MRLDHWQQHEPVLLEFERSLDQPDADSIEIVLGRFEGSGRLDLLKELVLIKFEVDLRKGRATNLEPYLEQFPELADPSVVFQELIEQEFELRNASGTPASGQEIERRFPTQPAWIIQAAEKKHSTDSLNALPEGTLVDSFRIGKRIGQGAFSVVYSAWDTQLERDAALKLFALPPEAKFDFRDRLKREGPALAKLSHPGVVSVFRTGTFQGADYIVSQKLAGDNLAEILARQPFEIKPAVDIVHQLALALEHCHQAGVIHRDIKPANIMFNGEQAILIDFGLATSESSIQVTRQGDLVGTPAFMSPEQAAGRGWQSDCRSDVYSLGAVLYQLVCNRLPFDGSVASVIHQVMHRVPDKPRAINNNIPRDLETIILKALEKHPTDRYQSAADLALDLKCLQEHRPIYAKPPGLAERTVKWCQRFPVLASAVLGLAITLVFLIGAATQLYTVAQERDRAMRAETTTRELLAKTSADTGLLAMQRGQLKTAIDHFDRALSLGCRDSASVKLKLVAANVILRNTDQANQLLDEIEVEDLRAEARLKMWQAELTQSTTEARNLFCEAIPGLVGADLHYAKAMLAPDTPAAIAAFQSATELDPFHFVSRRGLIYTLLASAKFESARQELDVALELFPESQDLHLLRGLALAGVGDLQQAKAAIDAAGLAQAERQYWVSLANFLFQLRTNVAIDTGAGELDTAELIRLLQEFRDQHADLIFERQWRLPLALNDQISELGAMLEHSNGERLLEPIAKLASIHPEATMLIISGNHRLKLALDAIEEARNTGQEIDHRISAAAYQRARNEYEQALHTGSFLRESTQLARKGIFGTSASLALIQKVDIESNTQQMLEAVQLIDQARVNVIRQARVFGLIALQNERLEAAEKWIDRWFELAKTQHNQKHLIDSLWHRCILNRKREDWLRVKSDCERILEIKLDHTNAQRLLGTANEKIRQVLSPDD